MCMLLCVYFDMRLSGACMNSFVLAYMYLCSCSSMRMCVLMRIVLLHDDYMHADFVHSYCMRYASCSVAYVYVFYECVVHA